MSVKVRLQRVLQILEEAERTGALSLLEQDMVLAELREAYSEVKFGEAENKEVKNEEVVAQKPTAVVEPAVEEKPAVEEEPVAEEESEPEMEVEIIFNEEEDDEEAENGEPKTENDEVKNEEVIEAKPATVVESAVEEKVAVEKRAEEPAAAEELSTIQSQFSAPKRSPLLSLYEDGAATPVIGEQFREQPSVADKIACPKGVAESTPVASLREAIGVADKFMLISELFGGDSAAYERAIDALDSQPSFDDCVIYITEHFSWRAQSEATKSIMSLLQRKFNE